MSDEGLELLKGFVEECSTISKDRTWCQFCQSHWGKLHEPDCLWARARAYLRDQGVEVKDDE